MVAFLMGLHVGFTKFSCYLWDSKHNTTLLQNSHTIQKIGNLVISDRDRQGLQDDLSKISSWSARWEMPFHVKKCHTVQVGTRNLKYDYETSGEKLESVQCVKDGVTIASNLKFSQQCIRTEAAGKANRMLSFTKRFFLIRNKDIILPPYNSLVRPHLEYAVQFWSPHLAKDIAKLEAVQPWDRR